MLRNEVRVGRKTTSGQDLQLPKVAPYLCYSFAIVQAAVYATAVRVSEAQGPEAAGELLLNLGFSRTEILQQGEVWRLVTGCFVEGELLPFAVVGLGLLAVAPRVEASLGYRTFASACVLSALAAADAVIAVSGPTAAPAAAAAASTAASAAAGAESASLAAAADFLVHPAGQALAVAGPWVGLGGLGVAMGLAGCAVAHERLNGKVERKAGGGGLLGGLALAAGCVAAVLAAPPEMGGAPALAGIGAAFSTGFLIASVAGPRYQVTQELELPSGAMWVEDPDKMEEFWVVLDQTTNGQRTLATNVIAVAVAIATVVVIAGAPR
ncbi:hypothetical protein HYH03_003376 [Edaphochlamys debaryana]|uniref:Uncharacterized protein n=1 Tax=Edaphochlamys debaryana TaxID=47281 RepID=A0A835YBF2_9CHLO|nr:hypothetical protein HYH03_003376 [Edaphochlamys debaryana]|eukprot:KAG2498629.1 hypothetical protein HYH03_003376 [Edaphochlamys debaryana]